MALPEAPVQEIKFSNLDVGELLFGQKPGLNMGTGFSRLYEASLAEDAYQQMLQQAILEEMLGARQSLSLGVPGADFGSLLQRASLAQGVQQPAVAEGGIADTVAGFQQQNDYQRFLEALAASQDPSGLQQFLVGALPLIGAAAGSFGGVPGASLGMGIGSSLSQWISGM